MVTKQLEFTLVSDNNYLKKVRILSGNKKHELIFYLKNVLITGPEEFWNPKKIT